MDAPANVDDHGYYEVEVEEQLRRVYPRVARRAASTPPDSMGAEAATPSVAIAPATPEQMPMRQLIWRAIKRTLNYWFPPDPPNVIAVIRMPERIYCARCGTMRVSKYCPTCGANVDKLFTKMVRQMAQYVVQGTAKRRREIARSVQEQVEIQAAEMVDQIRRRVEAKLAMLERTYVMEIARQRRTIDRLLHPYPPHLLPSPRVNMVALDPSTGDRRDTDRSG